MNLIRKRIKYLLEEIKTQQGHNPKKSKGDFCIINLLFDTNEFLDKCSSIGTFMKRLRNGKISLEGDGYDRPKQTNREYFNEICGDGGFYRYNYGYKYIELNIYLDLKNGVVNDQDKEIIKSRVSKLVKPKEFKIGFNDKPLLDKTFRDLSLIDTGWSVFGKEFRNKDIE